ncbi:MAG: RING finger domain-containing protein [Waddliaceae bacterium]
MSSPLNNNQGIIPLYEIENAFNQTECVICIEDFNPQEPVTALKCNHIFHSQCINDWQNCDSPKSNHCPICFQAVVILDRPNRSNSLYPELLEVDHPNIFYPELLGVISMLIYTVCILPFLYSVG